MRREPHPTHSHLAKTLAWIERVRPRRAVLTHMDQSLDYRELCAELPGGVEPGYDGLDRTAGSVACGNGSIQPYGDASFSIIYIMR